MAIWAARRLVRAGFSAGAGFSSAFSAGADAARSCSQPLREIREPGNLPVEECEQSVYVGTVSGHEFLADVNTE